MYNVAPKRMKGLGSSWTKEVKDCYSENCKTWTEESKGLNRCEHAHARGWKTQYARMSVLPRAIYGLKAVPIKIPRIVSLDIEKPILDQNGISRDPE